MRFFDYIKQCLTSHSDERSLAKQITEIVSLIPKEECLETFQDHDIFPNDWNRAYLLFRKRNDHRS